MAENYITRERAEYSKGKTPIIAKYSGDHAKLFAEIAGRGFLALPGYAYDAETGIEFLAKTQLSELNYKILSETIERELKQAGIDYGIEYKVAVMAWEVEKQTLMTAWEAEYAGIKRGMMSEEDVLNELSTAVSLRAIILMNAKTAIDVAMEADKRTITNLEGDVAPYEVQLANAKLLVAQKKLAILPILATILTKEQELLVIEQSKSAEYGLLMAAEQEIAAKKQTLTPSLNALAAASELLALKIPDEIVIEQSIAAEKLAQATSVRVKAAEKVQELNAEISTEEKQIALKVAERVLETTKFSNEQILTADEIALERAYQTDMMTDFTKIIGEEKETDDTVIANKETIHATQNATRLESKTVMANAEKADGSATAGLRVYQATEVSKIESVAHVTAALTHLIG